MGHILFLLHHGRSGGGNGPYMMITIFGQIMSMTTTIVLFRDAPFLILRMRHWIRRTTMLRPRMSGGIGGHGRLRGRSVVVHRIRHVWEYPMKWLLDWYDLLQLQMYSGG